MHDHECLSLCDIESKLLCAALKVIDKRLERLEKRRFVLFRFFRYRLLARKVFFLRRKLG